MDVLGYLGASSWRSGCVLVGSSGVLVCSCVCIPATLFWYVFTQGYLDPVRPRAPPYAPVRVPARLRAPMCVSFSAPWFVLGFPVRLRCLPLFASTRYYACLFRASYARPWLRFCIVFCMALLAFLLCKALALSFIHTSAFCIIYILSNACVPKTFLYKSCI